MEIVSNRISATPRSKYVRYGYGDTYIRGSGNSGSANVDLSNYVKLTGERLIPRESEQLLIECAPYVKQLQGVLTHEHD